MASIRVDSYDIESAKKLLAEWDEWVNKDHSKTPHWPSWSGKATALLRQIAEAEKETEKQPF